MKKKYTAPEVELIRFNLNDVLTGSVIEGSMPEQFATEGGGEDLDIGL